MSEEAPRTVRLTRTRLIASCALFVAALVGMIVWLIFSHSDAPASPSIAASSVAPEPSSDASTSTGGADPLATSSRPKDRPTAPATTRARVAAPDEAPSAAASRLASALVTQPLRMQTGDDSELAAVATGAVQDELSIAAQERYDNRWTVEGVATLAWVRIVEDNRSATPPSFRVQACVDSSNVRVLDDGGRPLSRPGAQRAINEYVIVESGGSWVISSARLTTDPPC